MQIKSKRAVLFHIVYVTILFILTFILYRYSILTIGKVHSLNVATSISNCIEYRIDDKNKLNIYDVVDSCVSDYAKNTNLEIVDSTNKKVIFQSNNFKPVDFDVAKDNFDFDYTVLTGDLIIYKFIPDQYKQFKHSIIKQMIIAVEHKIPDDIRTLYACLFTLFLFIIFKLVKDYERVSACHK